MAGGAAYKSAGGAFIVRDLAFAHRRRVAGGKAFIDFLVDLARFGPAVRDFLEA